MRGNPPRFALAVSPEGGALDPPLILAALYLSGELQDIHLLCLMCGQGADVD